MLLVVGLVMSYLSLILWITAFLNPFVLILCVIVLCKYFSWMFSAVNMRILKKQKKNVS